MTSLRPWQFSLATQLHGGPGSRRKLPPLARGFGRRAVLLGYRDCPALEAAYAAARESLQKAGVEVIERRVVEPEPRIDDVERLAREVAIAHPEMVIALGGGSVIDCAKGMAILTRARQAKTEKLIAADVVRGSGDNGGERVSGVDAPSSEATLWDFVDTNPRRRPVPAALPVIALPTTAGTGAEITSVAVFSGSGAFGEESSHGAAEGAKLSITAACLRPAIAIVDPELTAGMSAGLTAAFAVDALAHAVEACLSRAANPMSFTLAAEAARRVLSALPEAMHDPAAIGPRDALGLAATLAGAALNESGVTAAHALAHALGAVLRLPHSVAVAMATPLGLRFNAAAAIEPLAELAARCGMDGNTPEHRATAFIDRLAELLHDCGLPARPRLTAGDAAAIELLARELAATAFTHTPTPLRLNPRRMDEPALRQLLIAWLS